MPVNQELINLAEAGDEKAVLLMMKWGYEGSKAFIGGNPVKKIVNSARDIREVLAVDLKACNNYKDGENAIKKIKCPTLCIFGDLDKMMPVKAGLKMSEQIKNSETNKTLCSFSLKTEIILDEVQAGGRIPLIIGRGLTGRAREELGLEPSELFRKPVPVNDTDCLLYTSPSPRD